MSKRDEFLFSEEDFHTEDLKEQRKEKKRLQEKDRSRFKKTDQDQKKKQAPSQIEDFSHLKEGRVVSIVSAGILVEKEHQRFTCSLKGSLKQFKEKSKNLVAVGDFVYFEDAGNSQGVIVHIKERFSILSRADQLSRNKEQLIAVNVDLVLITCSICSPVLKPALIDRYIIAAKKGNLTPIVVINKIDLLKNDPAEQELYNEICATYEKLHIPVIGTSTQTGEGIEMLKQHMQGKTSVFSGQSGTGKSSLINAALGTTLTTGPVVERTRKGSHTTTTTELIALEEGGWCVDTPGVQSFGLWEITPSDLASYYFEFAHFKHRCKYANCFHMTEPECAVQKAVEKGKISSLRFQSYCALMASLSENHQLR